MVVVLLLLVEPEGLLAVLETVELALEPEQQGKVIMVAVLGLLQIKVPAVAAVAPALLEKVLVLIYLLIFQVMAVRE
jgi:hypothetical protein